MTELRILVLYWHPPDVEMRAAVREHLRALERVPGLHVAFVNTFGRAPAYLSRVRPDAVVLHNTFLCMRWSHLFAPWKWALRWLDELDCPKIAMPQDEYDHAHVLDEWLAELRVSLVVSNFDDERRTPMYPLLHDRVAFVKRFTGYIDEAAATRAKPLARPHEERPVDIVYRASHLPYWFGSHGQLKHRVGSVVGDRARELGLSTDISTKQADTIVGDAWFDFLMSGRVVLGCESGSSVLDRRGEIRASIQAMLRREPLLSFDEVDAMMVPGWDDHAFFALSPRHFEAVVTKTCQVLVEGEYDGVLKSGRHYIAISRDFSNLDDVLTKIRNPAHTAEIAECAYQEIYLSGLYSYESLTDEIVRVASNRHPRRRERRPAASAAWAAAMHDDYMPGRLLLATVRALPSSPSEPFFQLALGARVARTLATTHDRRALAHAVRRASPDSFPKTALRVALFLDATEGRLPFAIDAQVEGSRVTFTSVRDGNHLAFRNGFYETAELLTQGAPVELIWRHDLGPVSQTIGRRRVAVEIEAASLAPLAAAVAESPAAAEALTRALVAAVRGTHRSG